jgi:DNA-binding transcriptional LysR family regulator
MSSGLNIRQLEAFRAMMLAGTTKGAAELIGLSQPAVSRLIDAFERSLALSLFERTRNRLTPTPEAHLLFEEVERTFTGVDRIRELAADIRGADAGTVTVAVLPALAFGLVPSALQSFRARHPRTSISVLVQTSPRIEELAAHQSIDFGLAEEPFSRPGLSAEAFSRAPLVVLLPRDHPLARRAVLAPADLACESLVALPRTSLSRRSLDDAFGRAGLALRPGLEAQYAALIAALVARGLGLGLVDPFTAAAHADHGLVSVPFQPALPFGLCVLHPGQRPLSRAARAFLATLRQERNRVLAPEPAANERTNATGQA